MLFYDDHLNSISVFWQPETIPDIQKESGLGMVDYLAVTEAIATSSKTKTRKTTYNHWSNKDRFTIGKYSAENGHPANVRKFFSKEKPLNESRVRRFCKHYKDELKQSMKEKREMKQELLLQQRGRPLMLRAHDEMLTHIRVRIRG